MFHLLDKTLKELAHDSAIRTALPRLYAADVSFITPDKRPVSGDTLSLFLYEVRENRELRPSGPRTEVSGGIAARRRAPVRVDCMYLVTAWSTAASVAQQVENEHHLLGEAYNGLSRHPVIEDPFLERGGLADQVIALPTMVAQMDGGKSNGEFWSALGIPPRPFFHLLVTICMDLDRTVDDALVTSIHSGYAQRGQASAAEEHLTVAGTLCGLGGRPVPDGWVRLEPVGETVITDASGRFVFTRAARGPGFTLRARASGYSVEAVLGPIELPSSTGYHDLRFP